MTVVAVDCASGEPAYSVRFADGSTHRFSRKTMEREFGEGGANLHDSLLRCFGRRVRDDLTRARLTRVGDDASSGRLERTLSQPSPVELATPAKLDRRPQSFTDVRDFGLDTVAEATTWLMNGNELAVSERRAADLSTENQKLRERVAELERTCVAQREIIRLTRDKLISTQTALAGALPDVDKARHALDLFADDGSETGVRDDSRSFFWDVL